MSDIFRIFALKFKQVRYGKDSDKGIQPGADGAVPAEHGREDTGERAGAGGEPCGGHA